MRRRRPVRCRAGRGGGGGVVQGFVAGEGAGVWGCALCVCVRARAPVRRLAPGVRAAARRVEGPRQQEGQGGDGRSKAGGHARGPRGGGGRHRLCRQLTREWTRRRRSDGGSDETASRARGWCRPERRDGGGAGLSRGAAARWRRGGRDARATRSSSGGPSGVSGSHESGDDEAAAGTRRHAARDRTYRCGSVCAACEHAREGTHEGTH